LHRHLVAPACDELPSPHAVPAQPRTWMTGAVSSVCLASPGRARGHRACARTCACGGGGKAGGAIVVGQAGALRRSGLGVAAVRACCVARDDRMLRAVGSQPPVSAGGWWQGSRRAGPPPRTGAGRAPVGAVVVGVAGADRLARCALGAAVRRTGGTARSALGSRDAVDRAVCTRRRVEKHSGTASGGQLHRRGGGGAGPAGATLTTYCCSCRAGRSPEGRGRCSRRPGCMRPLRSGGAAARRRGGAAAG